MNYIKEINSFYDWLETNSVSDSAITLWHAMMHINNKAGWKVEFTVASSVLCLKSGLSNSSFKRARNVLKQSGRIEWRERKGNQSAIYELKSFVVQYEPQTVPQSEPQSEPQTVPQSEPINKLKETKLNLLLEKEAKEGDFQETDFSDKKPETQERKKVAPKKEIEPLDMPSEFEPIWNEWKEYRKARKLKPYAGQKWEQKAVDKLLEYSNKDPIAAQQILESTYQNNYQGFFPLKNNLNGSNKGFNPNGKNNTGKISGTGAIIAGIAYNEFT